MKRLGSEEEELAMALAEVWSLLPKGQRLFFRTNGNRLFAWSGTIGDHCYGHGPTIRDALRDLAADIRFLWS